MIEKKLDADNDIHVNALKSQFSQQMLLVIKYFWFKLDYITIPTNQKVKISELVTYLYKEEEQNFNVFGLRGSGLDQLNISKKYWNDAILTESTLYFTFRNLKNFSKGLPWEIEIPVKVRFGDSWKIKYHHQNDSFSKEELWFIDLAAKWIWFQYQMPAIETLGKIDSSSSWFDIIEHTKTKMQYFGFTSAEADNFIFYDKNGQDLDKMSQKENNFENKSCELFAIELKNKLNTFPSYKELDSWKWFSSQRFELLFKDIAGFDDEFEKFSKYLELFDAKTPFNSQWFVSFESNFKNLVELIYDKLEARNFLSSTFLDGFEIKINSLKIKSINQELWENNFYPVNIAVPFVFTHKKSQKEIKKTIHFTNIEPFGGKKRFDQAVRILNQIAMDGINGITLTSKSTYEDALTLLKKQFLHSGYFNNIAWEMENNSKWLLKNDRDFSNHEATIKVRMHTLKPAQFDIKSIDIPKKARYSSDWISVQFHEIKS